MDDESRYDDGKTDDNFGKPEKTMGEVLAKELNQLFLLNLDYAPRQPQEKIAMAWGERLKHHRYTRLKNFPTTLERAFHNVTLNRTKFPSFGDLCSYLPPPPEFKEEEEEDKPPPTPEEIAVEYALDLIRKFHGAPKSDNPLTDEEMAERRKLARSEYDAAMETQEAAAARANHINKLCWHTGTLPPKSVPQYVHWEMVADMDEHPSPDGFTHIAAGALERCRKIIQAHPFTRTLYDLEREHGNKFDNVPYSEHVKDAET